MKKTVLCPEHSGSNRPDETVYGQESGFCWVEPCMRCHHETPLSFADKLECCLKCEGFKQALGNTELSETIDCLMSEDAGGGTIVPDLGDGFFEVLGMLTRLSRGDTAVRVPVDSGNKPFNVMKVLLNNMADGMQVVIGDSHEMAIGLCENYETLNRISTGDFSARSTVDSSNELVVKLAELINNEADVLTDALACAKKAEEANQTQLNFMCTLIDTIPTPFFYKDSSCRYLGCNKAFEKFAGLTREDLLGKSPHEIWPSALADNYRQQDLDMLENPGSQVYETSIRYADGSLREVIFNKATFNDSNGAVAGLVGVILDITERKEAEDALSFQNILLQVQQEASIDGLLVVDGNSKIISFNRRFVEIMNIPSELLVSGDDEPVLKYVTGRVVNPQQFLEKVRYLYEHHLETTRDEIELTDGTILDRYSVPLLGPDDRYFGRLWSFRDVTEHKLAEAEIKSAYQQLLDIVEFLPDATFVVDKHKRVVAWNRAIEKMTGLAKEDVIGKGDYIYSVPFYGRPRPILIDLLDGDIEVIKREYAYIHVEGRTLFAETYISEFRNRGACYLWGTATPLFDSQGNTIGGIESIRDITDYKLAENEKTRLESQLDHARLMETVITRLSHDLKTPLTPLFVLLPLLKKRIDQPDLKKMVEICQKSITSINNLVEKSKVIARLSSSVKEYHLEEVSLKSFVDNILSDCEEMILKKRADCRNYIDPAIVVKAVPSQLYELFLNLISNAVQFSAEQGVITVSAEQQSALTVSIQDEGVGLSPAHLDQIFDEFFKADDSRHDIDAPGLGLSICKRIVRNHDGKIWAESPGLGKGTTVKFTIHDQNK